MWCDPSEAVCDNATFTVYHSALTPGAANLLNIEILLDRENKSLCLFLSSPLSTLF